MNNIKIKIKLASATIESFEVMHVKNRNNRNRMLGDSGDVHAAQFPQQ